MREQKLSFGSEASSALPSGGVLAAAPRPAQRGGAASSELSQPAACLTMVLATGNFSEQKLPLLAAAPSPSSLLTLQH